MDERILKKHIEKLKKGRKKSFDAIFEYYGPKLYGFIVSINRYDASNEDIYQEVCLKVYQKIHTFDGVSFNAWVFAIARNTTIDHARKRKVIQLPIEDTFVTDIGIPEVIMEQRSLSEYMAKCIDQLPELDKQLILLRYFEDLSYEAIGHRLAMDSKEVKWRLYEAKQKLKKKTDRNEVAYGL